MSGQSTAHDSLLWANYAPHERAWDELFDRKRAPHEHCQALVQLLGRLAIG
ncbi:MAG: hypothetical protein HY289_12225, partial [Planctomycetes bacterium]|nr:hypothetical protein [Planctomycetota bacterium]